MARGIQAGDKAPDFTLPSQAGEPVRLSDRLGEHSVVLYFYPKDETRGCTAEACAFRDSYEVFAEAGAEVIASVGIGTLEGGAFGLTVDLKVSVPNVDRPTAEKLVARAHEVCPYSNATRSNIPVTLTVA